MHGPSVTQSHQGRIQFSTTRHRTGCKEVTLRRDGTGQVHKRDAASQVVAETNSDPIGDVWPTISPPPPLRALQTANEPIQSTSGRSNQQRNPAIRTMRRRPRRYRYTLAAITYAAKGRRLSEILDTLSRYDWPSILIGAIVTIMLTAAIAASVRIFRTAAQRSKLYSSARSLVSNKSTTRLLRVTTSELDPAQTKVGKSFEFPWITVSFGPFRYADISAHYTSLEKSYWPEVNAWYQKLTERQSADTNSAIYNSPGLRLVSFSASRVGAEERPSLDLQFCDTDYYRNLVSDQRLDFKFENSDGTITTLRSKYCATEDLRVKPFSGNACHFGVQLAVVTSDSRLVIPLRGNTAIAPGTVSPSVAEGALPSADIGPAGQYLPHLTALRGLREELGIADEPFINWLSFGVNPITAQYGLVGLTHVDATFDEVSELFQLNIVKDQWENSTLSGVQFTPEGFAQFVEQRPELEWSPFALIAFTHALLAENPWRRVRNALGDVSVHVAQA